MLCQFTGLMEYFESSEASDVRSAMQYEHLIKEIDIARPEGLELTLKDSAKQPGLSASTAQRFQMTKIRQKISSLNHIPTGQGRNQPLYERHVIKSGRNRVKY